MANKTVFPDVSVDCVVFGFHANELKVLLLKWSNADLWCLPKGSIQRGEPIGDAALRLLKDTTGIEEIFLQQFYTFGASPQSRQQKAKNKNAHIRASSIAIGFYALVDFEKVIPHVHGSYQWCEITRVPDLAFDHDEMIALALVALRKDLRYLPIAKLLPEKFTLREMQKLYETILGREFDRRNFHKLLMSYKFLIKLREKRTGLSNKPPHLYKINFEKYETALQDGISY